MQQADKKTKVSLLMGFICTGILYLKQLTVVSFAPVEKYTLLSRKEISGVILKKEPTRCFHEIFKKRLDGHYDVAV